MIQIFEPQKIMKRYHWIINISRPRFWTYLAGPWAVGMVTAVTQFSDFADPLFWVGMLFFLWPANFFLYGLNDFADRDTDQWNPKKGNYEGLYVSDKDKTLLMICGGVLVSSLFFGWLLPSIESQYVLLLWLLLSAFYSVGPLRLKSRLFLDSLSNVLYILPGVIVYLAYKPLSELSWPLVIGAWTWAMGMHLFSALPDIAADRNAKVKTTAVWLGHKYGTLLTLLYFATATTLSGLYVAPWMGLLGFLAYCVPTIYVLFLSEQDNEQLLSVYKVFPLINFICGGCIFIYIFFKYNLLG